MALRGRFRAADVAVLPAFVVVVVAMALASSGLGRGTNHRSSIGEVVTPARAVSAGVAGDPVPPTPAPRLIIESEKTSEPGPALWVGAVVGIGGVAGLAFASVGLSRRRDH